jgi:hypothetical protein
MKEKYDNSASVDSVILLALKYDNMTYFYVML